MQKIQDYLMQQNPSQKIPKQTGQKPQPQKILGPAKIRLQRQRTSQSRTQVVAREWRTTCHAPRQERRSANLGHLEYLHLPLPAVHDPR
jgi:hypothetical protein